MALQGFDKDQVIVYIPECGGNREDDNPTIVNMRFVPYSQVQKYAKIVASRGKGNVSEAKLAGIMQDVQRKQFCEHIESIENFTVNGRAVTEPEEFYQFADTELITEIIRAMESQGKLTEGQTKN